MDKETLIQELRQISGNDYELPKGKSLDLYLNSMLDYIGDTNPELRDELIYMTFDAWICEKDYFSAYMLISLMDILLDENHLFFGIGKSIDNTVFTRTFSILVIVLILCRHRKTPFFTIKQYEHIKGKLIEYYTSEKDLRGYVEPFGWAHGAAHGADAMNELVQCSESRENEIIEILNAVKKVLYNGLWLFGNEEDERIARVVYRILKSGILPQDKITGWFSSLTECVSWEQSRNQYICRVNTKNFIRCLYFKILYKRNDMNFIDVIRDTEEKLNRFNKIDKDI